MSRALVRVAAGLGVAAAVALVAISLRGRGVRTSEPAETLQRAGTTLSQDSAAARAPLAVPSGAAAQRSSTTVGSRPGEAVGSPAEVRQPAFDRQRDLFRFAFASADSTNPWVLVNAFSAAQSCIAMRVDWHHIEAALAAAKPDERTARAASAELIRDRCAGFFDNDLAAGSSIRRRVREQVQLNPSLHLGGSADPDIRPDQMLRTVAERDWVTAMNAAPSFIAGLAKVRNLSASDPQTPLLASAYYLSLCDLGADCSGQSILYAGECARFGHCAGSLAALYQARVPATQVAALQALRSEIAAAWRRGDAAFFGVRRP